MEVKMATRITVALEDDLDGGPAEQTLRFALSGSEYEIDLNNQERQGVPQAARALHRTRP
jgi:hypothetical protein